MKKESISTLEKKKRIAMELIALLLILMLGISVYFIINNNKNDVPLSIDLNATNEEIKGMTDEEIQDLLSKKVKETEINMTMSSSVVMKNGKSKANLLIENSLVNQYPQIVEIKLKDSDETIYKSELIPVGYRVDSAELNKKLSKGTHKAIAYFSSYDAEKKAIVGTGGAEIEIIVQN